MRRIVGLLCVALVVIITSACTNEHTTSLGVDPESSREYVYPAQDLPFPEATIVVVHPWTTGGVDMAYLITLDSALLARLSAEQHVVWRTAPRDLTLGMRSRDGVHLTQVLRAEPGGTYFFRTSRHGLDRTTQAEGQALVELNTPAAVQLD